MATARIATNQVPRVLTLANIAAAVLYFVAICFFFKIGNHFIFGLLVAGELFHLWQAVGYASTIWRLAEPAPAPAFDGAVDVCITVAGEPVEIVETTLKAAIAMTYANKQIYLLNDSRVAKKANWAEYEELAKRYGVGCITRTEPGGAKAGNINNALKQMSAPYVAIFDADHVPHTDFLERTMGYFADDKTGFVQSPQYYANQNTNAITRGAWEQQEIFFGPILKGKQRLGAAFMCGTNMVIRKTALLRAGGMSEESIAEDFLTSLLIHRLGYKSVYVPDVLAEGLAPEDFLSYYKQQFRWARGSLEVIFRYNPLFMSGLSWRQKMQYLASASYYLSGPVVLMNALLPVIYFFTGAVVFQISTMTLAAVFLPYIFLSLYLLQVSSNYSYTYRALSFSMGSFWLQTRAIIAVITGQKTSFAVTSKTAISGSFYKLALPHILYFAVVVAGLVYAGMRDGITASYLTNAAWAFFNVAVFWPFVASAVGRPRWIPGRSPHVEAS
jgi:cellulose synthase (UDP-forming)